MLKIEPKRIAYHGWQIKIAIQNNEFVFYCYPPENSSFCNDGSTYSSFRMALMAARCYINREVAVRALLDVMFEWLEDDRISEDEYWILTDFD